jgi:micrococcal nuclease
MRDALALAVVLVAAAPSLAWTGLPLTQEATVVHVDDGDTIDVWIDGRSERVRYIGIDAPEIAHDGVGGEQGGEAATRLNQALLRGRRVRLEFDRERRDRYGRLLAYVWVGDVMINVEMVRRGYARVLTIPPNVRHARRFARAEAAAQAAHRGLWGEGALDHPTTAPSRRARPRSGDARTFRPFVRRRAGITMTRPVPSTAFSRQGPWRGGPATRAPIVPPHRGRRPTAGCFAPSTTDTLERRLDMGQTRTVTSTE